MRAGWSSEINQLTIGETLSNDFDGKVLNPNGVEIDPPFWAFKRLKKLHSLKRDGATGKRRNCEWVFLIAGNAAIHSTSTRSIDHRRSLFPQ
jgi:hypothetical protein